jgi:YfiH family protein
MKEYNLSHTNIFKFDIFEPFHEVKHYISTRKGGTSQSPYDGLNLGFGTDDCASNVLENRYLLAESIGIPMDWFVFPRQTHSANIVRVDASHLGLGTKEKESAIADTDALITNCKHIFLNIQVADCVPLLLFDPVVGAIAAIHAGWKGTVANITAKTILTMSHEFGTIPENIVAGIGPSIGACCYEIGKEVVQAFDPNVSDKIFIAKNGSTHLDLWKANQLQLIGVGVKQENIEISGLCTKCNHHLFFSSRQGNGNTGRFVAGIMLQ